MAEIIPGEIIQILHRDWHGQQGEGARWEKYEVLQVFPHQVLCRNVKGGYQECFTWYQLYEGRVIDRAELIRRMKQENQEAWKRCFRR